MPLMAGQWWQMRKSRTTCPAESCLPPRRGARVAAFTIYARSAILIVIRLVDMIRPWVRWQPVMLCTSATCTFCE